MKISTDLIDWARIFIVLFALIWLCAYSQHMQHEKNGYQLDIQVDARTR